MSFYHQRIETQLGNVHFVSDEESLYVLAYDQNWPRIRKKFPDLIEKESKIIKLAQKELKAFLGGKIDQFSVPFELIGTEFQIKVWSSLATIPMGKTISYQEQAQRLKMPSSVRAIAHSNGLNPISIILPCHRVIGKSGKMTGYAGGLPAKAFLLKREGHTPKE